jgi:hypothetical protein
MHAVMTAGVKKELLESTSCTENLVKVTAEEVARPPARRERSPCHEGGKRRRLEQTSAQDDENPLAALVGQMQNLIDSQRSSNEEFKCRIDDLAREILALKKF